MHVVTVRFQVKPEFVEAFQLAVNQQAITSMANSHGCRKFDVCFGANRERVFLYELYDAASDFQNHLRTPHFLAFSQQTTDWVASKEVHEWSLVSA